MSPRLVTLQAVHIERDREWRQNDKDEDREALHKYLSVSMPQDLKAPPLSSPLLSSPPSLLADNNPFINCWGGLVFLQQPFSCQAFSLSF